MYEPDKITPAHVRAARALLGWSRPRLAQAAGVSPTTVAHLELEHYGGRPRPATVAKIVAALAQAGVRFTPGGVALSGRRKPA